MAKIAECSPRFGCEVPVKGWLTAKRGFREELLVEFRHPARGFAPPDLTTYEKWLAGA
jgi:hypothetical protein